MAFQKRTVWLVKILLIASFLNGLCWTGLIPMWHTPDEQAHFAQAQNIVVGKYAEDTASPSRGFSTSLDIVTTEKNLGTFRQGGNNIFTYHPENKIEYTDNTYGQYEQKIENLPIEFRREFVINEATGYPPLYYWYIASINKIFWENGLITRVFISRLATILITTLAVYISYLLAFEIFKNKYYALLTASLVSFQPMWRFVGSGITSDALYNLIYPLLIFCIIKLIKGQKKYFWWTLAVFILGLITKLQTILLMPILISIWIWIAFKGKKYGSFIQNTAKILLLAVLIITTITVGNYLIPDFTFYWMGKLGLKWLDSLLFLPELSDFGNKAGFINYWKTMGKELYIQGFPWYWGVYRWLSLTLPLWIYRMIKIAILISGLGWVITGIGKIKRKREINEIVNIKGLTVILASIVTYSLGLLAWNFFFWRSRGYSFGIQGRYFFPNLPEHMILLVAGLLLFPLRSIFKKLIATVFVSGMMVFNWYSLYFVSASYYDISSWDRFFLQASQYKPWFFKMPILPVIIFLGLMSSIWLLVSLMRYNVRVKKDNKPFEVRPSKHPGQFLRSDL